ncbi:hypothetical protein [Anaeromyxobacter oryzae]|uniref:DUF1795 domain-containing protein n=1 Tax=Anaeromyxobacter oryzae TaxID=2918170 RepID=A0ABM7WVK7_9BACT|nr:hypothetical protein [Anaeromyxobacter oryzae]BDG03535.1 hypothetical protein AMOR_25310 [Anaeromyxobacter oryzae]
MQQDADQGIVEFRSPTRSEFLTVVPTTDKLGEAVSLKLRLDAQLHGFSARCEVWVERQAVADFASALRNLEETRNGEALLQGEDPDDLELKVSALDRVGHMLLEFKVTRLTVVGDRGRPLSVQLTGGFELDPGLLPDLVARVTRLTSLFTERR